MYFCSKYVCIIRRLWTREFELLIGAYVVFDFLFELIVKNILIVGCFND